MLCKKLTSNSHETKYSFFLSDHSCSWTIWIILVCNYVKLFCLTYKIFMPKHLLEGYLSFRFSAFFQIFHFHPSLKVVFTTQLNPAKSLFILVLIQSDSGNMGKDRNYCNKIVACCISSPSNWELTNIFCLKIY